MSDAMRIGVAGALGRMGRAVADVARTRADLHIAALIGRPDATGEAAGGLTLTTAERALGDCDVIIDFSTGPASAALAMLAAASGGPALVIGSTGMSESEETAVLAAAGRLAIVKSGNFSIGVTILEDLVEQAARKLGRQGWDIEIFEAHHRGKRDAPSGTAMLLANAAALGRGEALRDIEVRTRDGITGARRNGDIGFSVMRGGGLIGEHAVVFAADEEILTLSHSARDRRLFARGAIEAAVWVAGREAGLYDMADVLALRD
jgi:4-hydroxy-tetrahydrodipicolinate reductase